MWLPGKPPSKPALWALAPLTGPALGRPQALTSSSCLAAASLHLHPQLLTLLDPAPGSLPLCNLTLAPRTDESLPLTLETRHPRTYSCLSPLPASEHWELRDHASLIFISQYLLYTWHLVGHQPMLLKAQCKQCCKHLFRENPSTS